MKNDDRNPSLQSLVILANEAAGQSDADWLRMKAYSVKARVEFHSTPEDSIDAAARIANRPEAIVAAAGGDGSIGTVVQGLMKDHKPGRAIAALGILPLGTGNDLARALELPLDREQAWEVLCGHHRQPLDLIHMQAEEKPDWWISNIAVIGTPLEVYSAADKANKSWGPLGFIAAALACLEGIQPFQVEVVADDRPAILMEGVTHIVVANGRSMGGGVQVSPNSATDDGRTDLIFVRAEGVVSVGALGVSSLFGAHLNDPRVSDLSVRKAQLTFDRPIGVQCDGREWTSRTLRFQTFAGALQVVAVPQTPTTVEPDASAPQNIEAIF